MLPSAQTLTSEHPAPAGNISIPGNASASYTFSLQSDDGSMLYIDGMLLVNNTGTSPQPNPIVALTLSRTLTLTLP